MRSLIPEGFRIDFLGHWKPCAIASGVLILIALIVVPVRGIRLGIDFVGGVETRVRVRGDQPVDVSDVRRALSDAKLEETSVYRLGDPSERTFVIRARESDESKLAGLVPRIEAALRGEIADVSIGQTDLVGPRVGDEFRRDAWLSIIASVVLIGVYMAFRFSTRYVPGALLALVHDAILSAAAVTLFGLAIDFNVIAGLLTVVGYSLNDTIVIYDRIRENIGLRTAAELERLVNDSLNETLSRTVLTAGTTLFTSVALLTFGGEALRGFALAVTVGVLVGTYSSIYVASPALLYLSKRNIAPKKAQEKGGVRSAGTPRYV